MNDFYQKSIKPRPRAEWICEYIYRPLAHLLVLPLSKTCITPPMLVMVHTVLGLYACVLIAQGQTWLPALLLQIKSVLDNADGQLARATGQTSQTGRYLDTNMDFVVNTALFIAIGSLTGAWGHAVSGWIILAVIGSVDFNWEKAHRAAYHSEFRAEPVLHNDNPKVLAMLKGFYDAVFSPQDRLVEAFHGWRFKRVAKNHAHIPELQKLYNTPRILGIVVQLGLTTQLLAAGIFIALGKPLGYVYCLYAQMLLLLVLQLYREHLTKKMGAKRN